MSVLSANVVFFPGGLQGMSHVRGFRTYICPLNFHVISPWVKYRNVAVLPGDSPPRAPCHLVLRLLDPYYTILNAGGNKITIRRGNFPFRKPPGSSVTISVTFLPCVTSG